MIVGGLLASGLALGMGTASAADGDSCKIGTDRYTSKSALYGPNDNGQCKGPLGTITSFVGSLAGFLEPVTDVVATAPDAAPVVTTTTPTPTPTTTPSAATKTTPKVSTGGSQGANAGGGGQKLAAGSPVGALPPLAAAPPAAFAAAPFGVFSPAALGGIAPAGLASNLFGANAYDPGLLFGSPLGGAAAQLFNPKAGSGVTTVSQAQVLAAPSRGYGTPATIGVIILACLIGFAVRHRVISRMKARDLPEETAPRHAAPEVEQIDEDSDARTTVLTR